MCERLGIDDPCFWMNSVSPIVVDQWIAFMMAEREDKQQDEMLDPSEALKNLAGSK